MMLAILNNKNFSPSRCDSLRCTILSGAAATETQIKMFMKKLPNDHFLSTYGLSEMAPVSETEYKDTIEHVLYTVGKPLPEIEIKIRILMRKICVENSAGSLQNSRSLRIL